MVVGGDGADGGRQCRAAGSSWEASARPRCHDELREVCSTSTDSHRQPSTPVRHPPTAIDTRSTPYLACVCGLSPVDTMRWSRVLEAGLKSMIEEWTPMQAPKSGLGTYSPTSNLKWTLCVKRTLYIYIKWTLHINWTCLAAGPAPGPPSPTRHGRPPDPLRRGAPTCAPPTCAPPTTGAPTVQLEGALCGVWRCVWRRWRRRRGRWTRGSRLRYP